MLLGGCERMSRRSYDSYLPLHGKLHVWTHAEKQQAAINIFASTQPSEQQYSNRANNYLWRFGREENSGCACLQ